MGGREGRKEKEKETERIQTCLGGGVCVQLTYVIRETPVTFPGKEKTLRRKREALLISLLPFFCQNMWTAFLKT